MVKHKGTYRIFWSYASCIFPAYKFTGNSIFEVIKIDSNHSFLVIPWLRQSFAWSFTAETCVQSQARSCGICGRKPGTGTLRDLGNKMLLVLSFYVSTIFSAFPSLISMRFGVDAATHLKWRYGKCQPCIRNAFEALTFQNLKEM